MKLLYRRSGVKWLWGINFIFLRVCFVCEETDQIMEKDNIVVSVLPVKELKRSCNIYQKFW